MNNFLNTEDLFPQKNMIYAQRKRILLAFVVNLIVLSTPLSRFIASYYNIAVHELGHAVFGWLAGYPAIPAFNFVHGGGVTFTMSRSIIVSVCIYTGLLFFYYKVIQLNKGLISLKNILIFIAFSLFFFIEPLHRSVAIFMGEGMSVLVGLICCYLGLSHYVKRPQYEKNILLWLGVFLWCHVCKFCYGLYFDSAYRERYMSDPSSGITNDFVKLSQMSGWPITVFVFLLIVFLIFSGFVLIKAIRYPDNLLAKWIEDFRKIMGI
ncbi:M50 family metallopeptidase [Neisseria sp. Ec49-e6-T10]|uniref:M50 family metallopeptidase n=1 Tax=Neisseria sp. Ec49-e6-T10 TaxID=3140744 RepID=UPI003EBF556F